MNDKHNDQKEQCRHHIFTDLLNTLLQSHAAHQKSKHNGDRHPDPHFLRRSKQVTEHIANRRGIHTHMKGPCDKAEKITQHPSGNRRVIHHEHIAAKDTEPAVNMPFAPRFLQCFIPQHRALAAGSSDGQLHRQYRNSHTQQEYQIQDDKNAATVLSCHKWKTPDVSNTDGTACCHKQEAKP